MENFFSWMLKPIPKDEVTTWFNMQNIHFEKVDLFKDIFLSLHSLIKETYLGEDTGETKILLSREEVDDHFEWCWKQVLNNFKLENIKLKYNGEHKEYVKLFFMDIFYYPDKTIVRDDVNAFLNNIFDYKKDFTKSDLEILTEIYHLLNKNLT